eukprot:6186709-Pleurochrysis_carterae.AAC.8
MRRIGQKPTQCERVQDSGCSRARVAQSHPIIMWNDTQYIQTMLSFIVASLQSPSTVSQVAGVRHAADRASTAPCNHMSKREVFKQMYDQQTGLLQSSVVLEYAVLTKCMRLKRNHFEIDYAHSYEST